MVSNSVLPPRGEHPRPDFAREHWQSLNGVWQFAFDDENRGVREHWECADALPLEIDVPFCYQSEASGVHQAEDHPILWYKTRFTPDAAFYEGSCRLHFGAVDYRCQAYLNGHYLGEHEGGYAPFSFDITPWMGQGGQSLDLTLRVEDYPTPQLPRGKQSWTGASFGCWYTPVSGIWQSVYLEREGPVALRRVHFTPDVGKAAVHAKMTLSTPAKGSMVRYDVRFEGKPVCSQTFALSDECEALHTLNLLQNCPLEGLHLWSPQTPNLYDVTVTLESQGSCVDRVESYFGMRCLKWREGVLYLNGSRLYQRLILDQGYWPESLLTPPSDQAIQDDILWTKRLGYQGARKHQKIEDPRYYYWADKLGLLVWGEMPSAYSFCDRAQHALRREFEAFIDRDYNHPCIITWVPLNESWGVRMIAGDKEQQAFADSLYWLGKSLDPTRPISTNDGWEQTRSDYINLHDYTADPRQLSAAYRDRDCALRCAPMNVRATLAEGYQSTGEEVMLISEYGGIALADGLGTSDSWGYNGAVPDEAALLERLGRITQAFVNMPYLQGYCYTQLTDVFQEANGLLTMMREPKADPARVCEINRLIPE